MDGTVETTLALDQTITRFRFQYEKNYRQLRGSMERERSVLAQLADVKAQMVDNAQRLELALQGKWCVVIHHCANYTRCNYCSCSSSFFHSSF